MNFESIFLLSFQDITQNYYQTIILNIHHTLL